MKWEPGFCLLELSLGHEKIGIGTPGWLRGLVPAFGSGPDPGVPGSSSHRAPCMEPASPSACVSHE